MPEPVDRDVYPEPPRQTAVPNPRSKLPNPSHLMLFLFGNFVDKPVTALRDWIESQQAKRKFYYYHQEFKRVPDLSQCLEDDYLCHFEASSQWRRDFLVDQEIVRIIRDRFIACRKREGENADQMCAPLLKEYAQVCKGYKNRYEDLGYFGTARMCLMKQKDRMMKERKKAAAQGKANQE